MKHEFRNLLDLAENLRKDFDTIMVSELPGYVESPRYLELLQMIDEIKAGKLKEHPHFDYHGMGADELTKELMHKVNKFATAFRKLMV
jgi:thioredoxin-related protein